MWYESWNLLPICIRTLIFQYHNNTLKTQFEYRIVSILKYVDYATKIFCNEQGDELVFHSYSIPKEKRNECKIQIKFNSIKKINLLFRCIIINIHRLKGPYYKVNFKSHIVFKPSWPESSQDCLETFSVNASNKNVYQIRVSLS